MKTLSFSQCCEALGTMSSEYLEIQKNPGCFGSFFYHRRNDIKIAQDIEKLANRIKANMNFPLLSHHQKIDFLENCAALHERSISFLLKQKNNCFRSFHNQYNFLLKNILVLFCDPRQNIDAINLDYLDCYLDYFSCGIDTSSILKNL